MHVYIIGQQGDKQHVWHFQGVVFRRKKAESACVTPKFFYFRAKIGQLFGIAPAKAKEQGIVPVFPLAIKDRSVNFAQNLANLSKQHAFGIISARQLSKRVRALRKEL
jgi:hypothetical protein